MKKIKPYEKISTDERASKDLVFNGKGWKDSNEKGLLFRVIRNVSPFANVNIWLWGS